MGTSVQSVAAWSVGSGTVTSNAQRLVSEIAGQPRPADPDMARPAKQSLWHEHPTSRGSVPEEGVETENPVDANKSSTGPSVVHAAFNHVRTAEAIAGPVLLSWPRGMQWMVRSRDRGA